MASQKVIAEVEAWETLLPSEIQSLAHLDDKEFMEECVKRDKAFCDFITSHQELDLESLQEDSKTMFEDVYGGK